MSKTTLVALAAGMGSRFGGLKQMEPVSENGYLKSITERTKIKDFKYTENGEDWFSLAEDTLVSMNLWGFTPEIFDILEEKFEDFRKNLKDPMKDEFFLPFAVDESIKSGDATVKVFNCKDKWYGMTYKEDMPGVINAIEQMRSDGIYPINMLD